LVVAAILQLLHPISIQLLIFLIAHEVFIDAEHFCEGEGFLFGVVGELVSVYFFDLLQQPADLKAVFPSHHLMQSADVLLLNIDSLLLQQFYYFFLANHLSFLLLVVFQYLSQETIFLAFSRLIFRALSRLISVALSRLISVAFSRLISAALSRLISVALSRLISLAALC
jgi:hypothetical protein